ncbi:type II toxin-antitoxin system prevent-host-death family antitoxin [Acidipropionibacterium acidipropionici]|jgi:prevent-host-death family protein|uniref:Antitoxin n=2 Tax=Acidipropionibacterium acidipropionici TaxID=1748 RepID=A0A142KI38_9ACTN|nr:type II toxin-antitoxin system prevent-host-death family antitoxin [Acidipropionibacterium acidipropionici]AFV87880.1 Phd multi-domain protein [Acidipropionibacterium acidipropionici ATCC 4875]ALN14732.1 prevent-host-death protein [Acidipropionibacterium acidipropionici]AMS05776.1 prevent-host-death protein [Acidipropionibacterium acidipropionici]AOZ47242.1 prevent-host-death protein [Acidipropionibacterium acidipropionici]APZ09513.1 prevent-host-death protein [Acidipropionibacterium acidip
MSEVGIRELKQNASSVVRRAAAGEEITVTDRGRPVARLSAIDHGGVRGLLAADRARPPIRALSDLPAPTIAADVSSVLRQMRDEERY